MEIGVKVGSGITILACQLTMLTSYITLNIETILRS